VSYSSRGQSGEPRQPMGSHPHHRSRNSSIKLVKGARSVAACKLTFPVTGACPADLVHGGASARVRVDRGVSRRIH
jgi:hypothetical protein